MIFGSASRTSRPQITASRRRCAAGVANALNTLYAMGVNGNAFKRLALRLVLRFAGEQVGESGS